MLLSFDSVTGWSRMGPVALLALIYTGYLVLLGVYRGG